MSPSSLYGLSSRSSGRGSRWEYSVLVSCMGRRRSKRSKGEEGVKENEVQREGMRGKVLGKKGSTVKMGGRHGGGYFNMEDFELLGWKSIVTN